MVASLIGQFISAFAVVSAPVQSSEDRYGPRTLMAGTVTQMAKSARDAINCGFEVVTVRPWRDGDIEKPRTPRPMVLLAKPPADEARLQSAYRCFDRKSGVGDMIIL